MKLEMRFEGRDRVRGIGDKNVEASPVGSAVDSLVGIIFKSVAEDHVALPCAMHVERDLGNASESIVLLDADEIVSDPVGVSEVILYGRIILACGVGDFFESFREKVPRATGVIDNAWIVHSTSLVLHDAVEWE